MSDFVEHVDPFVSRTIAGKEYKFGKLTPRDRARLMTQKKAVRRKQLQDNLVAAAAPPQQIFAELEAFDREPWGEAQFLQVLDSFEGQTEILAISLGKYVTGEAECDRIVSEMAIPSTAMWKLVVFDICEYQPREKDSENPPAAPVDTQTPGPQAGTTYGT